MSYLKILLLWLFSQISLAAGLPDLGHPSEKILTPEAERELGEAFIRALKAQGSLINDELVADYIQNLGFRLASNSPEHGRDYHFYVINANDINAFAGPNATIGVNRGLILATKNESQLASVMAHEIAHVTQKHLTRAFQAGEDASLTTIATVLAGILVSASDPTAGAALVFGGVASGMQQQINFTRDNEYEADRVGIQILDKSGINPSGMTEFFEILQSSSFYGTENDIEYLRTHPLNSARIAEAASRTPKSSLNKPRDSLLFQLARYRLLVANNDNPAELIKDYPAEQQSPGQLYARALTLTRLNRFKEALSTYEQLIKNHNHLWFQLGMADTQLKEKNFGAAIQSLKSLYQIYPDYLPVVHAYARALVENSHFKQAIIVLEQQVQYGPTSETYSLLASCYSGLNMLLKAYTTRAEQYARDGFYEYAIQQLTSAIKLPDISVETMRRLHAKIQIYKNQHRIE